MLRGLHDTRVPMLFAALGYWGIGLPLGVVLGFPLGLGGAGIWIGLATGLAVVAVLMTARWIMRERLGLTGTMWRRPRRHSEDVTPATRIGLLLELAGQLGILEAPEQIDVARRPRTASPWNSRLSLAEKVDHTPSSVCRAVCSSSRQLWTVGLLSARSRSSLAALRQPGCMSSCGTLPVPTES